MEWEPGTNSRIRCKDEGDWVLVSGPLPVFLAIQELTITAITYTIPGQASDISRGVGGGGGEGKGREVLSKKQDDSLVPRALFPSNGRAP